MTLSGLIQYQKFCTAVSKRAQEATFSSADSPNAHCPSVELKARLYLGVSTQAAFNLEQFFAQEVQFQGLPHPL